jgi:Flp pilus assembly protein TadG
MVMLAGIAGLVVDVGRLYIAKNELQSFVDAAATAAALQLDGTREGIVRAQTAVAMKASGPDALKWDMATKDITNYSVVFANSVDSATWDENPSNPPNYRYAKVTAGVRVPLMFMRVFYGLSNGSSASTQNVNVARTAGQELIQSVPEGLLPYSPIAPDVPNANGHYGFIAGTQYTMRYPAAGQRNSATVCAGDANGTYWASLPPNNPGYWGSNEGLAIRGEIMAGEQMQAITLGQSVPLTTGQKITEASALDLKVAEDSDPTSTSYAQYIQKGAGNYSRVVALPINDGHPTFNAVAFGAFFLTSEGTYAGAANGAYCAEYIGPYTGGAARGFRVRLVE